MNDLISRSELLKAMNTWDKFGCDWHSRLVRLDNTNNKEYVPYVHYEDMVNCVNNMPTAYDIDKVVEELEKQRDIIFQDTDSEIKTVRTNAWNKIDILNKAIEIVKQGGIRKDVSK